MPTLDDLHAADIEHVAAIAAINARLEGHSAMLARHDAHLIKLDETIASMREAMGRVATKDDIVDLRKDINTMFTTQMTNAHNSVPTKVAVAISGFMGLLTLLSFALKYLPHGQ